MSLRVVASVFWLAGAVFAQSSPGSSKAPSVIVQPALDGVLQTLAKLHVERWKGAKGQRDEATANIASIHRDVDSTLPGLLAGADAEPHAASALLPAVRNLDAIYDVLLRVTITAETSAPQDQAEALDKALSGLDGARRTLADQTQGAALADEQRIKDLQATLAVRPAPVVAPAVPPAPASPPAVHAKKKKPVAKKSPPSTVAPAPGK